MKKRILSLLLVLLMVVSLVPTAVLAEETSIIASGKCGAEGDGSNLTWVLYENGTLEISGTGKMANWDYKYYYEIPWYYRLNEIKNVIINEGVTSIGTCAFYYKGREGTYVIGASITSVTIPNSVTSIAESAFNGCKELSSLTIPDRVTNIGKRAFDGCKSLTSITLPNSVTNLGEYAFSNCTSLSSVKIPDSIDVINVGTFYSCTGLTSVEIPSSVKDLSGFDGCTGLTNIEIPNSVTSIDAYAFSSCTSLASVTIPASVTSIGHSAFYGCTSLTNVEIPNSVTRINDNAFSGCTGLTSITIPDRVNTIGKSAFSNCTSLTNANIKGGKIFEKAFDGCISLENVDIDSAGSIGNYAFKNCTNLETVNIKSCESIGDYAFQGNLALKDLTTPSNLKSIGAYAFEGCTSLNALVIPSVETINNYAFSKCSVLTSVSLPKNVKTIGNAAFRDCDKITDVYYAGSETEWSAIDFTYFNEALTGATIHYGEETHTHDYTAVVTAPTCTEKGYTTYTCACGDSYVDNYTNSLGHTYKDGVCTRCGAEDSGYTPPHTHDYTAVVTAPTCTEKGYTTYTCACGDSYVDNYTNSLGHTYKDGVCTRCGAEDSGYTPPHTHDYTAVVTAPTCTEKGYTTYTCACGDSYVDNYTNSLGHTYKDGVCTRCGVKDPGQTHTHDYKSTVVKATCTEPGYTHYVCSCGDSYDDNYTDALGHRYFFGICIRCGEKEEDGKELHIHSYKSTVVEPTCTEQGYTEWKCECGKSFEILHTDALGHEYKDGLCTRCGAKDPNAHTHIYAEAVTKPSCTEKGYTTYSCTVCGDSYKGSYTNALGHSYANGKCIRCGAADPDYKPVMNFVDVPSTSYCYDAVQWAVANGITNGTDATHFSPNAGCTRAQVVTFLWRAAGSPDVSAKVNFVDVSESSVYYKAIKWAVANGITKGTDATHFSPNATCTRGQVATFMYRAAGEPAVSGSGSFSDVASGSYCYNAVQWAVANGITKGTDATHFSPNATCTRGQVVTFLYRAQ